MEAKCAENSSFPVPKSNVPLRVKLVGSSLRQQVAQDVWVAALNGTGS